MDADPQSTDVTSQTKTKRQRSVSQNTIVKRLSKFQAPKKPKLPSKKAREQAEYEKFKSFANFTIDFLTMKREFEARFKDEQFKSISNFTLDFLIKKREFDEKFKEMYPNAYSEQTQTEHDEDITQ